MRKIFFDFDGTLIDSRLRLFSLFQELVPQSELTFEEYWSLKKKKLTHEYILRQFFSYKPNDYSNFEKQWMECIEKPDFLLLDKPFKGVYEYLMNLTQENILIYLVTARQFKEGVLNQLENFEWLNLFSDILVTEQKKSKEELIQPLLEKQYANWIVGDTGKDIQTGKNLNIKTVAVLSGFLEKSELIRYNPDLIVKNVIEFHPIPY